MMSANDCQKLLEELREDIAPILKKRLSHVLGCEEECRELGIISGLSERDLFRLQTAALLHDITHSFSFEEHLDFCKKRGIIPHEEFINSPPTLHSLTGAVYAAENYPHLADDFVCDAIRSHTVGRPNMPIHEKILCLADYTEKTRKYPSCIELRKWLWDNITPENAEDIINQALYKYFLNTEEHIKENGGHLNLLMVEARSSLEKEINTKYK
ncbi:MAG: HD domain-containing protein [Ruminococcaceae bacterium]|nr:HD domain-containing protein [Oscillospiraceae bacterium]